MPPMDGQLQPCMYAAVFDASTDQPRRVICPLALVGQWADEINKMAVGLTVIKHQGTARTSGEEIHLSRPDHRTNALFLQIPGSSAEHMSWSQPTILSNLSTRAIPLLLLRTSRKSSHSRRDQRTPATTGPAQQRPLTTLGAHSPRKHRKRKLPRNLPSFKLSGGELSLVSQGILFLSTYLLSACFVDEAHNIKNEKTKGAIACCELQSKFRWCLTGTPMYV